MTHAYFAIGTTLANMANLEITLAGEPPPTVLDGRRIPLLGPVAQRTLDQSVHRHGAVNVPVRWDVLLWANLDAWIIATFGYSSASAALYASWLDETGHYSPFAVTLERPYEGVHYRMVDSVNVRDIEIPGYKWTLQTNTETSDVTITTSERLNYVDTSGGTRTMTLFAGASATPYTVYSFIKTSASNTMTIDGNGAETIDGNATKSATALNARIDIYWNGTQWISI